MNLHDGYVLTLTKILVISTVLACWWISTIVSDMLVEGMMPYTHWMYGQCRLAVRHAYFCNNLLYIDYYCLFKGLYCHFIYLQVQPPWPSALSLLYTVFCSRHFNLVIPYQVPRDPFLNLIACKKIACNRLICNVLYLRNDHPREYCKIKSLANKRRFTVCVRFY